MHTYYDITDASSHNDDTDKAAPMEGVCEEKSTTIDSTTNINLDQLDTQKEMTDEDVMRHLDVIENIELDPETFGISQPIETCDTTLSEFSIKSEEEQKQNEEIVIEDFVEEKWYEMKVMLHHPCVVPQLN